MEQILLLSTVSWINVAGGDWGTAGNWQDENGVHRLPGPVDDAVINVPGAVSITHALNQTDTVASLSVANPFTLSGGTLTVTGALSSTNTFQLSGATTLSRAHVQPGTTLTAGGSAVLDQVTVDGTVRASGITNVTQGLTLGGGLLDVPSGALHFNGDQLLGGNGEIHVTGFGVVTTTGNVTFAAGVTVRGTTGNFSVSSDGFLNQGTIIADGGAFNLGSAGTWSNKGTIKADGGQLTLFGNWSNTGQIILTATAGSALTLRGNFTTAGMGTITQLSGPVNIDGVLDNTGSTFTLNATTGPYNLLSHGILKGGRLSTADGVVFTAVGGTLDQLTLAGHVLVAQPISITNGFTFAGGVIDFPTRALNFIGDQIVSGAGEFHLSTGTINTSGNVTFGPQIVVRGTVGSLNISRGTFTSQGTIIADGGIFSVGAGGTWTNAGGTIDVQNGTLDLFGSFHFAPGSTVHNAGGSINIRGTLDNTGQTLLLDDSLGAFFVDGGTIRGGRVNTSGTNDLEVFHTGTLDGVTLGGTLNLALPLSNVTIKNGLTLNNGLITIGSGSPVTFSGSQTLTGTGAVLFADTNSANRILVPVSGSTLTFAPGITVHGQTGRIDATDASFVNQGTIAADGGGSITAINAGNFSGGTLTGGSWRATANSTLRLIGTNVTTNAANITIDGAASHFYSDSATANALASLAAVAAGGSLTLLNGAPVSTSTVSFSNSGVLNVGATSSLTIAGDYTQAADSTTVDGTLSVGGSVRINGGTLSGSGKVQADVVNNGQISPGSSPGILTVTGNFTQTAGGSVNIEIGGATPGTQYDRLHVLGAASLNGTLNINLIGGFGPAAGQTFQIVDYVSVSGHFATINGLQHGGRAIFTANLGATSLVLNSLVNASDLAFTSMSPPASAAPGQDISLSYTVSNLQNTPAVGDWYDSVYLTSLPIMNPDAQLLGRVHHVGDVAGRGSYMESLTAPLPNLASGNYHIIVLADSRGLTADLDRTNNTGVSSGVITIMMPALTIGTPISGTIAAGQDLYYRLVVPPGQDVNIAASFSAATQAEFYVRYGSLPDRSNFDLTAQDLMALNPKLSVANAQGGDYFILLHGREGAGAGRSFTLTADGADFAITRLSQTRGSNQGDSSTTLIGTRFTPQTTVTLANLAGAVLSVADVQFVDSQHIGATFHLQRDQVPVGMFNVRATDHGVTITAAALFNVSSGFGTPLSLTLLAPAQVRIAASIPVTVTYQNAGGTNVPAPIIELRASGVPPNQEEQQFLAGASNALPGFLPPEFEGSVGMSYDPPAGNPSASSNFELLVANPSLTLMDWDSMKEIYRPSYVSKEAWAAVWANFRPLVGSTLADFYTLLRNDSMGLARAGDSTNDIAELVGFELTKAADSVPALPGVSAMDLGLAALGFPLLYGRALGSSLLDRFRLGRLGRGWTDNYDISASTDSNNFVTIRYGHSLRFFGKMANGSYVAFPGEYGALTALGNGLSLREPDGSVTAFRADGLVDYLQDANGHRITAAYSGGRLWSVTHSDGSTLTFTYNSAGFVSQVADSTGRVAIYAYDAAGHLTSVTTPQGTTSYTYTPETAGPRAYAVASITSSVGTHMFFQYDSQGRLARQERDGGAEALTYVYGVNGYSVTDALGRTTSVLFDHNGRASVGTDALGHLSQTGFDQNGNLTAVGRAGGGIGSFTYDAGGNVVSSVDPLGQSQSATYDAIFNRMTSWSDARNNTTAFGMDASGNLQSVTYADGSSDQFRYDTQGRRVASISRSGQRITYDYNGHGQLIQKTHADGTHIDYTYDAHGNIASATDATGATILQYDAGDRLTKITYPSGQFIRYVYTPGGQRTQMIDQDGFAENYAYDAAGRLTGVTDAAGKHIVDFTFDAAGQLVKELRGNGTYTTYEDDRNGRLLHLVHFAPDNSVQARFDYTYDDLGRQSSVTTLDGTTSYGYDALGRLTSVTLSNGRNISYQYDAAGNRTLVDDGGGITAYATNNMNQYTSVAGSGQTYDANGNLVGRAGETYAYDAEGRLTGRTGADGTWAYQYDAFGNRSSTTHNGQTTRFLIDPSGLGNVFGEYDGSGRLIAHYTQALGLTSRVDAGGQAAYYDFDGHGNTSLLTGSNGAIANHYRYLPFGESLDAVESIANPFTYVGRSGVARDGNGLYFMRQRFYDPGLGRFIQSDPIGLAGGNNLYAYALNNPVSLADPTGLVTPVTVVGDVVEALILGPGHLPLGSQPTVVPGLNVGGEPVTKGVLDWVVSSEPNAPGPVGGSNPYVNLSTNPANLRVGEPGGFTSAEVESAVERAASRIEAETAVGTETKVVAGAAVLSGPEIAGFAGAAAVVWAASSVISAEGYKLTHQGQLPPCSSLLPESLKIITACDNAPIVTKDSIAKTGTQRVGPRDPNEIFGPGGFGPQQFIQPNGLFPYIVYFENDPHATAPAQQVVVTEQLDPNLDWSTFELGSFGFGNVWVDVPSGRQVYHTHLDERATRGLFIDFTASLNPVTGVVTWTFTSLDPATLDIPIDLLSGFLPPDDTTGRGQGFVTYFIKPRGSTPTGTAIKALAGVVFDTNAPVDTPTFTNTIDAGLPTSSVQALPATITATSFLVSWSGQDDTGGSGIRSFDVFVSDNSGPFTPFLTAATQTSATFTGEVGHTYGFYSVAIDNVGHVQPTPTQAQATTSVAVGAQPGTLSGTVFQDININGMQDAGEPGMAGQTVFLDLNGSGTLEAGSPTAITDATGDYQFAALTPGTYMVRQVLLGGVLLDAPASGALLVTVTSGANVTGLDFAEVSTSITVPLTLPLITPFPKHGNANADYVEAIYRAVLNRDADPAGLAFWTSQLNTGALSRLQVVQGIRTSPEHFTQEVSDFYFTLLSRAPDPSGLQFWVQALESGLPEEQMAFDFLDSPEYLSKGDKFFIDHMYLSLLGRTFDSSGEQFWLNQLGDDASGNATHAPTLTHEQIITDFLRSPESLNRLVEGYYQIFLQRLADPQGLNFWLTGLQAGQSFMTIGQDFLTSTEFYDHAAAEG